MLVRRGGGECSEAKDLLEELLSYLQQPVATLLAPTIAAVLGVWFGRRKTVHDRLYEERAKVVAALFERYETVDQRFASLVHPMDLSGEPDKNEKAVLAAKSFNELQDYYRRKSIWLSRGTSDRVRSFIDRYRQTFHDFQEDSPYHNPEIWIQVWQRFEKESPEIRERLETEFRAALGYRGARLRRMWLNTRPLPSKNAKAIESGEKKNDDVSTG